jgi:hypothetical protein
MTARRKTGPFKNPGYKRPTGKPPPCPQALCRCGHARREHTNGYSRGFTCDCPRFVLAKPAKEPSKRGLCLGCEHPKRQHEDKGRGGCDAKQNFDTSRICSCERYIPTRAKKPTVKRTRALARFGSTESLDASMLAVAPLPPVFRQGPCGLPPLAEKLPTPRSKEIARLRTALSHIALVLDRNDSPSHVLAREAQRIATDALKGG